MTPAALRSALRGRAKTVGQMMRAAYRLSPGETIAFMTLDMSGVLDDANLSERIVVTREIEGAAPCFRIAIQQYHNGDWRIYNTVWGMTNTEREAYFTDRSKIRKDEVRVVVAFFDYLSNDAAEGIIESGDYCEEEEAAA